VVLLPSGLNHVLRAIVPPLITAYTLFVAMVVLTMKRPAARRRFDVPADTPPRSFVSTMFGGYAAFLVIVLVFHVWLADDPEAFSSAVWGGAFLSGVALITAWIASLIGARRRR
jgi:hypothetical protein